MEFTTVEPNASGLWIRYRYWKDDLSPYDGPQIFDVENIEGEWKFNGSDYKFYPFHKDGTTCAVYLGPISRPPPSPSRGPTEQGKDASGGSNG